MHTPTMAIQMSKKLWSKESLAEFRVDYDNALLLKQDRFIFHNDWYDIGFAKYLIEYLQGQFKDDDNEN